MGRKKGKGGGARRGEGGDASTDERGEGRGTHAGWVGRAVGVGVVGVLFWVAAGYVDDDAGSSRSSSSSSSSLDRWKHPPITPSRVLTGAQILPRPAWIAAADRGSEQGQTLPPKKGRSITPVQHSHPADTRVNVYTVDNFLSEDEVQEMLAHMQTRVWGDSMPAPLYCFDNPTTLAHFVRGTSLKMKRRWWVPGTSCVDERYSRKLDRSIAGHYSRSSAMYEGETPFATELEERIEKVFGLRPRHGGKWQFTQYPSGVDSKYFPHTDCRQGNGVTHTHKHDRYATILMYLTDSDQDGLVGGATKFPRLGVDIVPKRGRALVFNSMSFDECLDASMHEASEVTNGTKVILQRWYYQYGKDGDNSTWDWSYLGTRPPNAPVDLPPRKSQQPRVYCDGTTQTATATKSYACRWYDDWSYEHIFEWRQQYDRGAWTPPGCKTRLC
jgi:hypothetical protein